MRKQISRRGLLLVVFLLIAGLTACGEKSVATTDSEFEANQMFVILNSNGFRVGKTAPQGDLKTWTVTIDEGYFGDGEAAAAIQVLHDYGLPRQPEAQSKDNASSLGIVSDREEKEKQKRELQRQIENQLYTLPDVIRASVIIALPTDDVFSLGKTPPTASVSLVLKETQPKFTLADVQNLVSGGVPNLKPENVKVALSQQALSEIPLDKLAAQRRSNTIFFIGTIVMILLALALGAVWFVAKKRRALDSTMNKELPNADNDESDIPERTLLAAESDE